MTTKLVKRSMTMFALAAVAAMAIAPIGNAFAQDASSNISVCGVSETFETTVKELSGNNVKVSIDYPSTVCTNKNFDDASITLKDGDGTQCGFNIGSAGGNDIVNCGSNFDITGINVLANPISVDYSGGTTVNFAQLLT